MTRWWAGLGALAAGLAAAAAGPAGAGDWAGPPGHDGWHHVRHHGHRHGTHHRHWAHGEGPPVFLSCSNLQGPYASPIRPVDCDDAYVARGRIYNAPLPPALHAAFMGRGDAIRARY